MGTAVTHRVFFDEFQKFIFVVLWMFRWKFRLFCGLIFGLPLCGDFALLHCFFPLRYDFHGILYTFLRRFASKIEHESEILFLKITARNPSGLRSRRFSIFLPSLLFENFANRKCNCPSSPPLRGRAFPPRGSHWKRLTIFCLHKIL